MKHILAAAALAALISSFPVYAQGVGFGDDIPLQFAVKRIVPEGMNVKLSPGVDGSKTVSWTGGDNWRQALEQAVAGTGYTFTVNSGEVVIAAAPATSPAAVQVAAAPAARPAARPAATPPRPQNNRPAAAPAKPRASAPARPQAASAPVASIPVVPGAGFVLIPENGSRPSSEWQDYGNQGPQHAPAPVEQEWVVGQGDDLKGILDQWAAKSGWRVVWESEYSYSLSGAARFRGDFVTASTELLRSMQDVRPVPTAKFHQGNMVLVIANNGLDEAN